MIKFFRSFRKQSIERGKLRQYLLYALGETIIVVIGILIALSINNWNNNRIQRQTEQGVYEKLLRQIEEDREQLSATLRYNQAQHELLERAKTIVSRGDRQQLDTLVRLLPQLYNFSDFHRSGNIYQNLVNSGDYKLLRNAAVTDNIQRLEELYIYINRLEANHFKVIYEYGNTGLVENVNFSTGAVKDPDALYSFRFENLLFAFLNITEEKAVAYRRALEVMEGVVGELEGWES